MKIIIVLILSLLLGIFICSQAPVQESLATAFHGEKIHKNKIESTLQNLTWLTAIIISLILIFMK